MTKIPVVIVDDAEVDRTIARRRFSRVDDFGEVFEADSGDMFLETFFNGHQEIPNGEVVPLILMDINMPGRDGFETIKEMEARIAEGRGPNSVAVMVFTSSNNPADRAKAEALSSVKGYITKPLDREAVLKILEIYRS